MPGALLNQSALIFCLHSGVAQPTISDLRVQVAGSPVVTQDVPYMVAGCALSASGNPCVTGNFVTAAIRVTAGGVPVLLQDSQAVCVPNGAGVIVAMTQPRVTAQ